jgi:hypothetical protein
LPITSTLQYLKAQLNGLAMPGGIPNMAAYITPPDPNVEADIPTCYIWPTKGREQRESGRGGTIPRNTGPQTPSGTKPITHMIDLFVVYFGADDDPAADSTFPGIVDAVMYALRTDPEDPAVVTDPWTGQQSQLIDVGETMSYEIVISAVEDQRYNRYDSLIIAEIMELIQA